MLVYYMHIILLLGALVLMVLCHHVITVGIPVRFLTCMISYAYVCTLSMQVNGVNLLRIHSTGPYAYALTLLDTLFTREEQHPCLLFKLSNSEKPGLDPIRVEILLCKLLLYLICVLIVIPRPVCS